VSIARTIAKNTLFNFIETGTDFATGFVTGIVLARSLGVEQYGLYAYLAWLLGLIALITDLGVGETSKRFIAETTGRGNFPETIGLVRLVLVFKLASILIVALVFAISSGYWASLTGNAGDRIDFLIIALTILPYGLNTVFISIMRGFQKYEYATYVMLGTAPLRLILIIALMVMGFGVREILLVQVATSFLGAMFGLYFLGRLIPFRKLFSPSSLEQTLKNQAFRYALTLASISILSYLAYNQVQTYFIGLYCPVGQVGFFRIASQLSQMAISLLPGVFGLVLMPPMAEQFGKGDMGKIKTIYITSSRYLMMVALPMAVGQIVVAGSVITLLYGAEYAQAIPLMQILTIPVAIFSIGHASGAVVYGINRPGFILKVNAFLAVLNIGLSLWLIPRYGVLGAAISSSMPLALNIVPVIIFALRNIGAAWPVRDTIKIATASLIMGVAVFALQSHLHLSAAVNLALCITFGVIIYVIAIFFFRVIQEQDLVILNRFQNSLPKFLRKYYILLVELMERSVVRAKPATGQ
jgi:O-antigen/teichoic acid export membrane protein